MKKILEVEELQEIVAHLAREVESRTRHPIHVHAIMNGAFMFAADFIRQYDGKIAEVSFPLVCRGYSNGQIHLPRLVKATAPYIDRHKLRTHVVLDAVVEEGLTLEHYVNYFPKILRPRVIVVALVQKGTKQLPASWLIGRKFDSAGFLYGYGMGPWRDWPAIYEREEAKPE